MKGSFLLFESAHSKTLLDSGHEIQYDVFLKIVKSATVRPKVKTFYLLSFPVIGSHFLLERMIFMSNEGNDKIEKRSYPRIKKLYLISYVNKTEGHQTSPVSMGRTLDISPVGVRIEVYRDIKIDSIMEMEIGLKELNFSVQGKVVRVQEVDKKVYILGIQFDEFQPELGDLGQ